MATSPSPEAIRVWRVDIGVPFPVGIAVVEPPKTPGALPERIGPSSRIPVGSTEVDGLVYEFSMADPPVRQGALLFDPESARIVVCVEAESAWDACMRVRPGLERILENLAFQMQCALIPAEMEVLDVTPPVAVGENREVAVYSDGEPLAAFRRLRDLGAPSGLAAGDLDAASRTLPTHLAAAQRWYIKSLATAFEHDQFVFVWIALETLWEASGVQVARPLRHRDHIVPTCPVCGEADPEGSSRGGSIIEYLTRECGVSLDRARQLWDLRQMVHGQAGFSQKRLEHLSGLLQELRRVVFQLLATQLKVSGLDGSAQIAPRPVISMFGIEGGTRPVRLEDLKDSG